MTILRAVEWYEELPPYQQQNLWRYLNSPPHDSREVAWHLIHLAWSSPAALAIAPLQDLLNLGAEARMNVPGHAKATGAGAAPKNYCRLRILTGCGI